jgi:hypothetical protein
METIVRKRDVGYGRKILDNTLLECMSRIKKNGIFRKNFPPRSGEAVLDCCFHADLRDEMCARDFDGGDLEKSSSRQK